MATFTTRTDAIRYIERCIEESSGGPADARAEYDIDAIADQVISDEDGEYTIPEDADAGDVDAFWDAVWAAARPSVLDQLNDYQGDNVWEDVIYGLAYDEEATGRAYELAERNPAYSDMAVIDGVTYRHTGAEWAIA